MIRINLFPVRQARLREKGKQQLAIGIATVSVVLAMVVVYHGIQTAENARIKKQNQALSEAIDKLKKELGDYDQIKQQRADYIRQREILQRLQNNRGGPVYLMRELSDILSVGKGPSYDQADFREQQKKDPNPLFNFNWDVRRLWLRSMEEKGKRMTMKGSAKSSDDVAEFAKRLKISPFFNDVYWQQTTPQHDTKTNVDYVDFDLRCGVNY